MLTLRNSTLFKVVALLGWSIGVFSGVLTIYDFGDRRGWWPDPASLNLSERLASATLHAGIAAILGFGLVGMGVAVHALVYQQTRPRKEISYFDANRQDVLFALRWVGALVLFQFLVVLFF